MSADRLPDGLRVARAGPPAEEARAALIMVHGRGGAAEGMLELAGRLETEGLHLLAPQAPGGSWYPRRFLAPLAENEPALSRGLAVLEALLADLETAGLPAGRVALLGFSQGACLVLEQVVRRPRRYGAVLGLSGGLIGPPGTRWARTGSLEGTPVFLGCSEADPHIPRQRVIESREVLAGLGAEVVLRWYPGSGHEINEDEIAYINGELRRLGEGPP